MALWQKYLIKCVATLQKASLVYIFVKFEAMEISRIHGDL